VSPLRPDLVAVWVFRRRSDPEGTSGRRLEFLLIQRSGGRPFAGLWQCVTGRVEPGERVAAAALRELGEEIGVGPNDVEAFYDLDQVALFHEPTVDGVLVEAVFAVRVRPEASLQLSGEHVAARWVSAREAIRRAVWPAYRESVNRIVELEADPRRAAWMELDLQGNRRPPPAPGG
jgi:8-oxo-dGTP pyrophosphatase MutT (NUDIX family)